MVNSVALRTTPAAASTSPICDGLPLGTTIPAGAISGPSRLYRVVAIRVALPIVTDATRAIGSATARKRRRLIARQAAALNTMLALVPPKPKLLDSAMPTRRS